MENIFDTIIWGPSVEGIRKAAQLKEQGQNVLLAGKFGFPGGKATESLSSLFEMAYFEQDDFLMRFFQRIKNLRHGVIYQNTHWVLLHPEAVKRVCWEMITEAQLGSILFHVMPMEVSFESGQLQVFGREGVINLHAGQLFDLSDDRYLHNLSRPDQLKNLIINCFFAGALPAMLPGFQVLKQIETPVGNYLSFSMRQVRYDDLEQVFNRELDRLSQESWKKYQTRISIIPVYPEIRDLD